MLRDGRFFKVSELACHDGSPYPDYYAGRLVTLLSLLDKVREAHGSALTVVSGYRSPAYNARLAQDSTAHQVASGSFHVQGQAADLRPVKGTVQDLYQEILALYRQGNLSELGGIGIYPESNWVHIDCGKSEDGHLRMWRGT